MDALLTTFVAAGLAEFGDKTQLLVIALAVRYGRPGAVIAGVALAAAANALLAAFGGVLIHDMITLRAVSLLVAVALLYAGLNGFARPRPPELRPWRTPVFVTAATTFLLAEFGDKSQLLTAALAAQYDAFLLAAAGAAGGVIAANLPGALLGARAGTLLPLRAIRYGVAACFLLASAVIAVNALRLI